jgi:hypothetical protein
MGVSACFTTSEKVVMSRDSLLAGGLGPFLTFLGQGVGEGSALGDGVRARAVVLPHGVVGDELWDAGLAGILIVSGEWECEMGVEPETVCFLFTGGLVLPPA